MKSGAQKGTKMKTSNGLYEGNIVIRGRSEIVAVEVQHNDSVYIDGREGTEYALRFRNNSGKRVLVVTSVDGMSVLDGKPAGFQSDGYVIAPYQTVDIPGWMVDHSTAAKFVFARKGNQSTDPAKKTYAEQRGTDPANIGIIGFAVFAEKEKVVQPIPPVVYVPTPVWPSGNPWGTPWGSPYDPYIVTGASPTVTFDSNLMNSSGAVHEDYYMPKDPGPAVAASAASTPTDSMARAMGLNTESLNASPSRRLLGAVSQSTQQASQQVGTGFGEATTFNTTNVDFDRASDTPEAVITLIYDSLSNLARIGVPTEQFRPNRPSAPRNAFPASPEGCPPPAGWDKNKRR